VSGGRPPKYAPPEPRRCETCGEWFTPKYPSAVSRWDGRRGGRFCSAACRVEGLRKYPKPEPRECLAPGCDRTFTPKPAQAARGAGLFCSKECAASSETRCAKGREGAIRRNEQRAAMVRELKARDGLLEIDEVAERLGVHPSVVSVRKREGRLAPAAIVMAQPLYALAAVEELEREWIRGADFGSADDRRTRWLDEEKVVSALEARGALERLVRAGGLTRREAENVIRARVQNRLRHLRRHLRGRKPGQPKPAYHLEWARRFTGLRRVPRPIACEHPGCSESASRRLFFARGLRGSYCAAHARHFVPQRMEPLGRRRPPSLRQAALEVARADFRQHPERWPYDPDDARDAAAKRVARAVQKTLQISGTRNAAA
jgi:hypothetical protein